jgi:acetyl-CoA carboxylase biotin carboxyl carrier protein
MPEDSGALVPDLPVTPGGADVVSGPIDPTELLAVIERLEQLLADSDMSELEVAVGETSLLLRKPGSVAPVDPSVLAALAGAFGGASRSDVAEPVAADASPGARDDGPVVSGLHAVLAPLTGIYYGAPAPDAAPYLREGGHVSVGQVIGLIEAMKLFNEIKSDVSGRVVRIAAENGTLVKAKQPLIEVDPA